MKIRRYLTGRNCFFLSLLLFTAFKFFFAARIPLTGDEAYHWTWSRHLALGYYDHPPMIAWLVALFTRIGGGSLLMSRMAPILCTALTTWFTYLLGREMGGEKAGFLAGFFSLTATGLAVGSILISTDAPAILFWQITVYLVWLAVKRNRGGYWYLAGVTAGLGLLSKFLFIPLLGGIFLFLILSETERAWLRRKEPYLALAVALALFTPFLYWNSKNGWATFAFNLLNRHLMRLDIFGPFKYSGLQMMLIVTPVLYGAMLWSLAVLFRIAAQKSHAGPAVKKRTALFILCTGWILPVLFFLQSFTKEIGAHWPAAGYGTCMAGLALLINGTVRGEAEYEKRKKILCWIYGFAAGETVLLMALSLLLAALPVSSWAKIFSFAKKEKIEKALGPIYGWEEMGQAVSRLKEETGADLAATSSYSFSSMLSFYTPEKMHISLLGPGSVYGRNYDIWDRWREQKGKSVLFISLRPIDGFPEADRILRETCASYKTLPSVGVRHCGEVVKQLYFAVGYDLKADPYIKIRERYRWSHKPLISNQNQLSK
ncbi:MAG: glycosyltransferase family 39 protein [Bacillota bacterium]